MIALPDIGSATAVLLIMGAILAISIGADTLCRRLGLPRISALVLLGVAIALVRDWGGLGGLTPGVTLLGPLEEPLVTVALVMVAFLLGGDLQVSRLRKTGGRVLILSLAVAIGSTLIVGAGMLMVGASVTVALALGAMAAATDPAAVREVVRDGAAKSTLGRLLLDVVAIDDAWGIILFGLALALAGWLVTADGVVALAHAGWELGGALMLGAAIGGPAAYMTGRLRSGQPTQTEAIAVVLLVAGLSTWLEVSPLLAAMTTGAVIANLAPHHTQSFREIEQVDWPFLVFFFVLAGAKLDMARAL
ncbi:MAG: cation:proton antiporter, partial [Alphaproteobacteria bacterium]